MPSLLSGRYSAVEVHKKLCVTARAGSAIRRTAPFAMSFIAELKAKAPPTVVADGA